MKVHNHAMQRYVKRIIGIENGIKAREYADLNKYEVTYKILQLYNESELLIKSYAPTRKETLDYYINGELLIIVEPKANEISTLYYLTLDEDNKTNKDKVQECVKRIQINCKNVESIKKKLFNQNITTNCLGFMIDKLKGESYRSLVNELLVEKDNSINICKEYAGQEKQLRLENRELMTYLFKKHI